MKRPQLIGLAIASVAGLAAFMMVSSLTKHAPAPVQVSEVKQQASRVLVASVDIPVGRVTSADSYRWQEWPESNVSPDFITEAASPSAATDFGGFIARVSVMAGEPISQKKFVKPGSGGLLAVLLSPGMRAISTKIKEETAVANLVLPNDRVDVIVTRRSMAKGKEQFESTMLFGNVRVLAIGQQIENPEGKSAALQGMTATLELTPSQAEQLALANTAGEISLSLRPLADLNPDAKPEERVHGEEQTGTVKVIRYGVSSRAFSVN